MRDLAAGSPETTAAHGASAKKRLVIQHEPCEVGCSWWEWPHWAPAPVTMVTGEVLRVGPARLAHLKWVGRPVERKLPVAAAQLQVPRRSAVLPETQLQVARAPLVPVVAAATRAVPATAPEARGGAAPAQAWVAPAVSRARAAELAREPAVPQVTRALSGGSHDYGPCSTASDCAVADSTCSAKYGCQPPCDNVSNPCQPPTDGSTAPVDCAIGHCIFSCFPGVQTCPSGLTCDENSDFCVVP